MASTNTGLAITVLMSRVFVFIFLLVSVMILATNKVTIVVDDVEDGSSKTTYTFKNFKAYRYLLSVAVIGCVYTLMQIPLAAMSISKGNNLTQISQLVIFTDMVFTSLFATGVGAGFGITVDLKLYIDKGAREFGLQDDPEIRDIDKFLDLVHVSTGFLLLATVSMVVLTILTTHALARK